jgi:aspartate--ammonia ligase
MADKKADLAGPGIGTYEEVEKILPTDYASLLDAQDTQIALAKLKRYIEDNLCKELNLFRIECPLIVDTTSGVND